MICSCFAGVLPNVNATLQLIQNGNYNINSLMMDTTLVNQNNIHLT